MSAPKTQFGAQTLSQWSFAPGYRNLNHGESAPPELHMSKAPLWAPELTPGADRLVRRDPLGAAGETA